MTTPDSIRLGEFASPLMEGRPILMSTAEAVSMVHGEITTVREGAKTHQGVQTNLADVICGGESFPPTAPVSVLMQPTSKLLSF